MKIKVSTSVLALLFLFFVLDPSWGREAEEALNGMPLGVPTSRIEIKWGKASEKKKSGEYDVLLWTREKYTVTALAKAGKVVAFQAAALGLSGMPTGPSTQRGVKLGGPAERISAIYGDSKGSYPVSESGDIVTMDYTTRSGELVIEVYVGSGTVHAITLLPQGMTPEGLSKLID